VQRVIAGIGSTAIHKYATKESIAGKDEIEMKRAFKSSRMVDRRSINWYPLSRKAKVEQLQRSFVVATPINPSESDNVYFNDPESGAEMARLIDQDHLIT